MRLYSSTHKQRSKHTHGQGIECNLRQCNYRFDIERKGKGKKAQILEVGKSSLKAFQNQITSMRYGRSNLQML